MGRAINQVFLMGRLTRDPELRTTPSGKQVVSFSLAVDKASGEGANFFDVTAWEKLAEIINQYTAKGSKVHVQGSLEQRTWEKDGQKRSKIEVTARDVTFLDTKAEGEELRKEKEVLPTDEEVDSDEPIDLSDIPF